MSTVEVAAPPVTKRDVLVRAADLLEEFGWCQNSPAKDEDGFGVCDPYPESGAVSFCLTGAVERAILDLSGHRPRYDGWPKWFQISREMKSVFESRMGNPDRYVSWNNSPDRTKAEVVALLREMAEVA